MIGHQSDSRDSWDGDDEDDFVDETTAEVLEPHMPDRDEVVDTLLVTAKNPAGTVSVTALLSGQVLRVELSPHVARLTESQLAEEIGVISTVARKQALAAQHAVAARMMERLGHDRVATRAYLEHDIGLPSPQTVLEEKARMFTSRYADEF